MEQPTLYDVRAYFDNGTTGTWIKLDHPHARSMFDGLRTGTSNVSRPATCIEVRDHATQHVLYTWLPGFEPEAA